MLQKYIFPDFCLIYLGGFGCICFSFGFGIGFCGGGVCVLFGFLFACFIYFGLLFSLGIYLELLLADHGPTLLIPGKQKCQNSKGLLFPTSYSVKNINTFN